MMDNTGRKQEKRVGFTKANRTSNGRQIANIRTNVRNTQGNGAKTMDNTGRKQAKRVGFTKANRTSNGKHLAETRKSVRNTQGN